MAYFISAKIKQNKQNKKIIKQLMQILVIKYVNKFVDKQFNKLQLNAVNKKLTGFYNKYKGIHQDVHQIKCHKY